MWQPDSGVEGAAIGSKSYCSERGRSVRVVLYENHPAAPEGEGLVNWDWPRRVGPGIHDHGVADLGDHDRIASSPGGQEALEDASDLVAIGAQGRAVIMIVVEAILGRQLMVIARVRDPTPGHMLIEQSDETLDVGPAEPPSDEVVVRYVEHAWNSVESGVLSG